LAIGLVLVGAGVALPGSEPRAASAPTMPPAAESAQGSPRLTDDGAQAGPQASGTEMMLSASLDPKASPAAEVARVNGLANDHTLADGSLDPRVAGGDKTPGASPRTGAMLALPGTSPAPDPDREAAEPLAASPQADQLTLSVALLALGVVLAAVSLLVLGLAWLARRTEDPLLR
jgi:hypothetical protein